MLTVVNYEGRRELFGSGPRAPNVAPLDPRTMLKYGGGVDSTALLCLFALLETRPARIVFADTGAEKRSTMVYIDKVQCFLRAAGLPELTIVRRQDVIGVRNPDHKVGLFELMWLKETLPSMAYGFHKCADKYKVAPSLHETRRLHSELIEAGSLPADDRVPVAIGYDADERHRVKPAFGSPQEAKIAYPVYPLFERGITRDDCIELIKACGLPVPPKSACYMCPNNSKPEYARLFVEEPDRFAHTLLLEMRALASGQIQSDTVGLLRRAKRGERLLHQWAQTEEFWSMVQKVRDGEFFEEEADTESYNCMCAL